MPRISEERAIHTLLLLASPVLILLLNPNWPFQGFGDYDSFYYFGHFLHFPHYQKLQPTYAGERLSWILPGYLLCHLLTPVYGVLVLHLLAYYASTFSLYAIVAAFSVPKTALLAALALGFHPYFLSTMGIDYVTPACLAYCLVTFALLVRAAATTSGRRWVLLFAAGSSWVAAIFAYPLWAAFTPACFLVYAAGEISRVSNNWRTRFTGLAVFAAGGAALTLAFYSLHRRIYGASVPFMGITRAVILSARHMKSNPFANQHFTGSYADWLVFPGFTAALSILLLLPALRRKFGMSPKAVLLLAAYQYFVAVMLALEPSNGMLQFDYFASFLIPGTFIVLGISFFDIAHLPLKWWFWLVVASALLFGIAPLVKPGLYVKPPILGAVVPGLFFGTALVIRFSWPRSLLAMSFALLSMGASSFCLTPVIGGIAWHDPSDWMSAMRRVGTAVKVIENRLPVEKYPVFWFQQNSPHGLEYQAIMCAFLAHSSSMQNFPEDDPRRVFAPGQLLVLLTDQRPGPAPVAQTAPPLWDQRIDLAGVTFWITAIELR